MAFNRRLIFWLIKAYIKKWRKTIFIFFIIGLVFFFILRFFLFSLVSKIPLIHRQVIGSVGAYPSDNLPPFVLKQLSRGLTSVDKNGNPLPDLASSWEIKENGKTYVFHLKQGLLFVDGTQFTSSEIHLAFSDVKIQRPDQNTIVFRLKDVFSPFPVNISKPIFRSSLVGLGRYRLTDIKLNGTFVASLSIANTANPLEVITYQFYPTQESLKIAFVLGNISKAVGLTDLSFENTSFNSFPNATVSKGTNFGQLVTIFYNNQDKTLSDKRLRDALSYALPNKFNEGERANSSIQPLSFAYQAGNTRVQDLDHAQLLLKQVTDQSKSNLPVFTVSVLPSYKGVYQEVAKEWKKVGINTKMREVSTIPENFNYEIFIGNFNLPKDPDQYTLWHSDQLNNITGYKSIRIDKLLEDGRKTLDQNARIKIYADFQKYLQDDQPASFLYFPYTYTVTRK